MSDHLYFILDEDRNAVKVGRAADPAKRVRQLQTGNPTRLRLLYVFPSQGPREREFHERFAEARISGEWFKYPSVQRLLTPLRITHTVEQVSSVPINWARYRHIAESKVGGGFRFPYERFRKELREDGVDETDVTRSTGLPHISQATRSLIALTCKPLSRLSPS